MIGIEVIGISKNFKDIKAVCDVSFSIDTGEIVGFLGPNGAGKTTTMRILTTYLKPDKGTAKIKGFDIIDDSKEVRKRIGYVPENAALYEEMSVIEYLEFVCSLRGISNNQRKERIKNVIDRCGLEEAIQKFVGELSKGYRQRLCLAQALIHNPEILIFDEPTHGLDPKQIIEIRGLIKEIGREKTIILSTHIMQEVTACCSRVIIINRGEILATGRPDELSAQIYGGRVINVILTKETPTEIQFEFEKIASVKNVIKKEHIDGWLYEIVSEKDIETRRAIFEIVRSKNATLLELTAKKREFEDIFLEIINGQSDPSERKNSTEDRENT
ncbi:MAG: ATP-binding cassette domain-containing protein [Candidatus Hydrogenedentota bacterium]